MGLNVGQIPLAWKILGRKERWNTFRSMLHPRRVKADVPFAILITKERLPFFELLDSISSL